MERIIAVIALWRDSSKYLTNTLYQLEKQEINLLFNKTKNLFKKRGLILNWKEFEKLDQVQQINTISMIAPISNEEKQKLLEAISIGNKTKTLLEILEFYLYNNSSEKMTIQ